jgi:hypothetical protein
MDLRIDISKDGKIAHGLYSDKFGWQELGECTINRATDVRFCNESKKWMVHILDEGGRILDGGHENRSDAIAAEIIYLNKRGPLVEVG